MRARWKGQLGTRRARTFVETRTQTNRRIIVGNCDLLSIEMKLAQRAQNVLDSIRDVAKGIAREIADPSAQSGKAACFDPRRHRGCWINSGASWGVGDLEHRDSRTRRRAVAEGGHVQRLQELCFGFCIFHVPPLTITKYGLLYESEQRVRDYSTTFRACRKKNHPRM